MDEIKQTQYIEDHKGGYHATINKTDCPLCVERDQNFESAFRVAAMKMSGR